VGRQKQFDEITGGVLQKDLRPAGARHDIVAELHADRAQSRDLTRKIVDDEVNAVPAAGPRALAIGHRSPGRACRAAEQQPQRSELDGDAVVSASERTIAAAGVDPAGSSRRSPPASECAARPPLRNRKFADSPLEGDGFDLSVKIRP
jgi:hypothetical protein